MGTAYDPNYNNSHIIRGESHFNHTVKKLYLMCTAKKKTKKESKNLLLHFQCNAIREVDLSLKDHIQNLSHPMSITSITRFLSLPHKSTAMQSCHH